VKKSKEIFTSQGRALGDSWTLISFYITLGRERGEIIRVSKYQNKRGGKKYATKYEEVLSLLDGNEYVELVNEDATEPRRDWKDWGHKLQPQTKVKWSPSTTKVIAYQFDGRTHREKNFPSPEVADDIIKHITNLGYTTIRLGAYKPLEECISILSISELFLGVESGFAYVASSVGTPLVYIRNGRSVESMEVASKNKKCVVLENAGKLKEFLKKYSLDNTHYENNASNPFTSENI